MDACADNPSTWEMRQGKTELEASLVSPKFKKSLLRVQVVLRSQQPNAGYTLAGPFHFLFLTAIPSVPRKMLRVEKLVYQGLFSKQVNNNSSSTS